MSRPLTPSGRAPPSHTTRSGYGSDERPTEGSQNSATMRLLTSVDENIRAPYVFPIASILPVSIYVSTSIAKNMEILEFIWHIITVSMGTL